METTSKNGTIITFYSYKGGTGRSMALANIACLIAREHKKRVLVIDWDLEAPGLHRFFVERTENNKQPGIIDLFVKLNLILQDQKINQSLSKAGWQGLNKFIPIKEYIVTNVSNGVDLIKAGQIDLEYSNKVASFNWDRFYTNFSWTISMLREWISQNYDYCLIDSRTGLTDTSGICTAIFPEKLVMVFTPNKQSLYGVLDVAERAIKYRLQSDDLRPITILPLPSRIDDAEEGLRKEWREEYQTKFEDLLLKCYRLSECDLSKYFDEVKLPYKSYYAYGEKIAVNIERDEALSLHRAYRVFYSTLINSEQIWKEEISENDPIVLLRNGQMMEEAGNYLEAIKFYQQSANNSYGLKNQDSQIVALNNLGNVYLKQGLANEAISTYQQSLDLLEKTGNHKGQIAALNNLGGALHSIGRLEESIDVYQKSLDISKKYNDKLGESSSLYNLANVLASKGEYENAEYSLQQSREILINLQNEYELSSTLISLGNILQIQGKFDKAIGIYQQCYDILVKLGDDRRQSSLLNSLADLYRRQGKYEDAVEAFDRSSKIADKFGDKTDSINISNIRNSIVHQQSNLIIGNTFKSTYTQIDTSSISQELRETLDQLLQAVSVMIVELPKEQAEEVIEDLTRLVEEAVKEKPNPKWYLLSIDGLTLAAKRSGQLGKPVIKLTAQVAGLLRI